MFASWSKIDKATSAANSIINVNGEKKIFSRRMIGINNRPALADDAEQSVKTEYLLDEDHAQYQVIF